METSIKDVNYLEGKRGGVKISWNLPTERIKGKANGCQWGCQNIGKNDDVFYGWSEDKFGMTYWHKKCTFEVICRKILCRGCVNCTLTDLHYKLGGKLKLSSSIF